MSLSRFLAVVLKQGRRSPVPCAFSLRRGGGGGVCCHVCEVVARVQVFDLVEEPG